MSYNVDCDVDLSMRVDVKFLDGDVPERSSSMSVSFNSHKGAEKFFDLDAVLAKFKKCRNRKRGIVTIAVVNDLYVLRSVLRTQLQDLSDSAAHDAEDYEDDVEFPATFAVESMIKFIEIAKCLKKADYQLFKDSDEPVPYSEASIEATVTLTVTES